MSLSVAVISNDTLHSLGIKAVLQEFYGIVPVIISKFNPICIEHYDLFIVEESIFVTNLDYFIPRRHLSIILSSTGESEGNIINLSSSSNCIIDTLGIIIHDIENKIPTSQSELSQREIEVLKLIAQGCLNKEIADNLNISINTVLTHRKNITAKLGIRSISGLSFYAMMHGYVTSI